jgi:hypothetical protein
MHNLHFILINADSAKDAASEADSLILHWGDENNWRTVGGIASEDGSDDIENHDDGRWGLSDLPDGAGTAFSRSLAWVRRVINDPIVLEYVPFTECPTLSDALHAVAQTLNAFDPQIGKPFDLWCAYRNTRQLYELVEARRREPSEPGIRELYPWQFDHFGLTDMTEQSEGARRYLVFIDMHS